MRRSLSIAFTAALFLAAPAAFAADAGVKFITLTDVEPAKLLPSPPADGSMAGKAELAELKAIEAARTPKALERAKSDDKTENASFFADVLGPGFDLSKLPATAKSCREGRWEFRIPCRRSGSRCSFVPVPRGTGSGRWRCRCGLPFR